MTPDEKIARLRRAANLREPADGLDVAGLDLSRQDLTGLRAERLDARGAIFEEAALADAQLADADLTGARLDRALLDGAVLGGATLDDASLRGASLRRAIFSLGYAKGADLADADLTGADLESTFFTGARLEGAVLEGARADAATFHRARLARADLRRARLTGASLRDADLTGADLGGADCTGADFRGATLTSAAWSGAALDDARFDDGARPDPSPVVAAPSPDLPRDALLALRPDDLLEGGLRLPLPPRLRVEGALAFAEQLRDEDVPPDALGLLTSMLHLAADELLQARPAGEVLDRLHRGLRLAAVTPRFTAWIEALIPHLVDRPSVEAAMHLAAAAHRLRLTIDAMR